MKHSIFAFTLCVLVIISLGKIAPIHAQAGTVQLLWTNPMQVIDQAVSKDGNYIAATNSTGLYYFASNDANPRWWYLSGPAGAGFFLSVAISANGEYVIAGNNTMGSVYYFNNSRARSGLQASDSYTWISAHFWGYPNSDVERGTIDISDNGEYVVVGGTGDSVYYFAQCTLKSGIMQMWNWSQGTGTGYVHAVDMSADGKYVAAGGPDPLAGTTGFVAFFKDANVFPYPINHVWLAHVTGAIEDIMELAVSDDGYSVVAVSRMTPKTLYYWAHATSLSGDPAPTWTSLHIFSSVDMSSDGNKVAAGGGGVEASLHYWDKARWRTGTNELEKWVELEGLNVWDVAISDDGNLIAATSYNSTSGHFEVYFFTPSDEPLGNFTLDSQDIYLSVSGNGQVVAVGGAQPLTLSVFTMLAPVGGQLLPVNMLELLSPYLLVFALAIVGAAALLFRRRVHRPEISGTRVS
jgi:WD40 repeat protein